MPGTELISETQYTKAHEVLMSVWDTPIGAENVDRDEFERSIDIVTRYHAQKMQLYLQNIAAMPEQSTNL